MPFSVAETRSAEYGLSSPHTYDIVILFQYCIEYIDQFDQCIWNVLNKVQRTRKQINKFSSLKKIISKTFYLILPIIIHIHLVNYDTQLGTQSEKIVLSITGKKLLSELISFN